MLYYADMDDNNPFQTNALAFPLASVYLARNSSSLGFVSNCQTFPKQMNEEYYSLEGTALSFIQCCFDPLCYFAALWSVQSTSTCLHPAADRQLSKDQLIYWNTSVLHLAFVFRPSVL
jgi:hypothetical protein